MTRNRREGQGQARDQGLVSPLPRLLMAPLSLSCQLVVVGAMTPVLTLRKSPHF